MKTSERVIVALDLPTVEQNIALVERLRGRASFFKVGMRAFYEDAEALMDALHTRGASVFLDLKLHDIPATVGGAMASLARWRPSLLTVHASGGAAMVRAAVETSEALDLPTRILGVTVLTSFDAESFGRVVEGEVGETVQRWAGEARAGGAAGLVCSGAEVARLRASYPEAILVVPGIRLPGEAVGDQRRVFGPVEAVEAGATHLVVGRPIHGAERPEAAWDAYEHLIDGAQRSE